MARRPHVSLHERPPCLRRGRSLIGASHRRGQNPRRRGRRQVRRVHPRLTENIRPLDDIWSAFSDFAEPVPALTDPPREGPNRMLAKFISGPYLHRLGPFRRFLKPNLDILREWIANGRSALAGGGADEAGAGAA